MGLVIFQIQSLFRCGDLLRSKHKTVNRTWENVVPYLKAYAKLPLDRDFCK